MNLSQAFYNFSNPPGTKSHQIIEFSRPSHESRPPFHPTHLLNPPLQKNRATRTQKPVIIDNGGSMVNDKNPIPRNGLLSASRKKVFLSPSAYSPLGRIVLDA